MGRPGGPQTEGEREYDEQLAGVDGGSRRHQDGKQGPREDVDGPDEQRATAQGGRQEG